MSKSQDEWGFFGFLLFLASLPFFIFGLVFSVIAGAISQEFVDKSGVSASDDPEKFVRFFGLTFVVVLGLIVGLLVWIST